MLWWAFASWRLHKIHSPLTPEGLGVVAVANAKVRGGKGGAHRGSLAMAPMAGLGGLEWKIRKNG